MTQEEKLAAAHEALAALVIQAAEVALLFGEAGESVPPPLARFLGRHADTFADIGMRFRELRQRAEQTLRTFCAENNLDALTVSRIERGIPRLSDEQVLQKLPALPVIGDLDQLIASVRVS